MKKIISYLIVIVLFMSTCMNTTILTSKKVEANATSGAMKFLKGSWVTWGQSQGTKIVFSKKYMKSYSLWMPKGIGRYSARSLG